MKMTSQEEKISRLKNIHMQEIRIEHKLEAKKKRKEE